METNTPPTEKKVSSFFFFFSFSFFFFAPASLTHESGHDLLKGWEMASVPWQQQQQVVLPASRMSRNT
jgi:hypothetical protein